MHSVISGLFAVALLFAAVCVYYIIIVARQDPTKAVGVSLVFALATAPIFLAIYGVGFAAAYWWARAQ